MGDSNPLLAALVIGVCAPSMVSAQQECATAVAVQLGQNGPYFTDTATSSPQPWTCVAGNVPDMWFEFVPTAVASATGRWSVSTCNSDFDTALEVYSPGSGAGGCAGPLQLLGSSNNYGPCGTGSSTEFASTPQGRYLIRVGGAGGARGRFTLELRCAHGFAMHGVAEAVAGSKPMQATGGEFADGWQLRWNYGSGAASPWDGMLAFTSINVGLGGSAPHATTGLIPGFTQGWAYSVPALPAADFVGPYVVGGADVSVAVPRGLFALGDTVRIQGLVLDPLRAQAPIPLLATSNSIEWRFAGNGAPAVDEGFEGIAPGPGRLPLGWDSIGLNTWSVHTGAPSSTTYLGGPTGAFRGANYLILESSSGGGAVTTAFYPRALLPLGTVSFALSRIAHQGDFVVEMDDGWGFVELLRLPRANVMGQAWQSYSLALPRPLPDQVRLRLRSVLRPGAAVGLDDVQLR